MARKSHHKASALLLTLIAVSCLVSALAQAQSINASDNSKSLGAQTTITVTPPYEPSPDELELMASVSKNEAEPQRDDNVGGKWLFIRSYQYWGSLDWMFDQAGVDYDIITDPSQLANIDLYQYDVIWMDGQQPGYYFIRDYNNNRSYIDNWVADGGCLYANSSYLFYPVYIPIHPGGLVRYTAGYSGDWESYTAASQDDCLLFDLTDWNTNTALGYGWTARVNGYYGNSSSAYTADAIANASNGDWQRLITFDRNGGGLIVAARYGFGNGQVVISGANDQINFNYDCPWNAARHPIFHYLLSLSNVQRFSEITLNPTELNFGEVVFRGQTHLPFYVTNEGHADLQISAMNVTGQNFAVDFEGALTLGEGESQTFNVTFTANVYGPANGSIEIVSDDPDEGAVTLSLAGWGVAAENNDPEHTEFIEFPDTVNTVAFSSDGSRAFVTTNGNYLYEVNAAGREIIRSIDIGTATYGVVVAPGDRTVYAGTGSSLIKIDLSDYSVQTVLNSPQGYYAWVKLHDMLISANGQQLYFITYNNPGWCVVVNLADHRILRTIGIGGLNHELALRPDGSEVWVDNWLSKWIHSINTTTYAKNDVYRIQNPWSICFSPDGEYFYVTNTWHQYMEKMRISDMSRAAIWFGAYYTGWAGAEKVFFARSGGAIYKDDAVPVGQGRAIQIGGSPKALEKNPGADELWIPGGHAANCVYLLPTIEPDITVAPTSLDFGDLPMNDQAQMTFDITNEGNAVLNVASMNITGGDFTVDFGGAFALGAGASRTFTVTYSANTYNNVQEAITIVSDDADEGSISIILRGRGVESRIAIQPEELNFGDVSLGSSRQLTFTINSIGNLDLVIQNGWIRGIHELPNAWGWDLTWPITLHPGGSRVVTVTYTPTGNYNQLALLNIETNADTWVVSCAGRGVAPEINVDPTVLDFGDVALGCNAQQTFNITNTGNAPLTISATSSGEFSANLTNQESVAPGSSRMVTVTYTANTYGPVNGAVTVTSNDPDEATIVVSCAGRGVAPEISVSPLELDFGEVALFNESQVTFSIANTGNAALNVSSLNVTGENFSVNFNDPVAIAAGGSQSFTVTYSAETYGAVEGSIAIASNDADEAIVNVQLTGTAIAPIITVDPASLDFGNVEFRRTVTPLTVEVHNGGNTGGTINSITIAGDNFSCDSEGGFDLAPGASQTITLDFEALAVGAASGAVTVESNDPVNETAEVSLAANVVWVSEVTLIARLNARIEGLRIAGNLNRGQANSLGVKLTNVVRHLQRNQANAALNVLNAFRNEVNDFIANRVLSGANGQPLIDEANFIAALIVEFGIASDGPGSEIVQPLPVTVNLAGAYPNPFNSIATIRYGLPESGFVSLVVHDLSGRQVTKLVNETVDAGWHEAVLDARDLNAGVYLVRLSINGYSETMKIVLIR